MGKIKLHNYTLGEELVSSISHGVGAVFGLVATILMIIKANSAMQYFAVIFYGVSLMTLFSVSTVYHGLKRSTGKKVLRVLDHCFIFFLILGTYTPFCLLALPKDVGMLVFLAALVVSIVGVTFTAIDLHKYGKFSMACYIIVGWIIVFASTYLFKALSTAGLTLLIAGGIIYTLGAVLYGLGKKAKYIHSIWHFFVLAGSVLHFICIYLYVL